MSFILQWYFSHLSSFGLLGVVVLMAMESSIFPVPSELVVPPAAVVYLNGDVHRDGAYLLALMVVLAGTIGSLIGASVTYYIARWIGRPLVVKYGKYFFITEKKLIKADQWMVHYGAGGIFIARLLPVVRHVISIPAGIVGMRFRTFALMTILGSFIWCSILAVFGIIMADDMQMLIKNPSSFHDPNFRHAFNNLTLGLLALVGVATFVYWLMARRHQQTVTAKVENKATDVSVSSE